MPRLRFVKTIAGSREIRPINGATAHRELGATIAKLAGMALLNRRSRLGLLGCIGHGIGRAWVDWFVRCRYGGNWSAQPTINIPAQVWRLQYRHEHAPSRSRNRASGRSAFEGMEFAIGDARRNNNAATSFVEADMRGHETGLNQKPPIPVWMLAKCHTAGIRKQIALSQGHSCVACCFPHMQHFTVR